MQEREQVVSELKLPGPLDKRKYGFRKLNAKCKTK